VPNLNAEARQVAKDVMSSLNGSASPRSSTPGAYTPVLPDEKKNHDKKSSPQNLPVRPNTSADNGTETDTRDVEDSGSRRISSNGYVK
jgi:hypothetical protein